MITAVDTNVLLDIVRPNEEFFAASVTALENAAGAGSLVICDLVYAELSVHFADQGDCDEFLGDSQIRVQPLGDWDRLEYATRLRYEFPRLVEDEAWPVD